jgi:hypothetical protein
MNEAWEKPQRARILGKCLGGKAQLIVIQFWSKTRAYALEISEGSLRPRGGLVPQMVKPLGVESPEGFLTRDGASPVSVYNTGYIDVSTRACNTAKSINIHDYNTAHKYASIHAYNTGCMHTTLPIQKPCLQFCLFRPSIHFYNTGYIDQCIRDNNTSLETHVALGGLVVSVLATGPKVRGFKPGRGRWILRVIKSVARLPSEGK